MATIGQQVAEQVTRISTEISEQTDLISQMNTALDDLGAVAGGSGGSVETCTVTVEDDTGSLHSVAYTKVIDGVIIPSYGLLSGVPLVLEDVMCSSAIIVPCGVPVVIEYAQVETGGGASFVTSYTGTGNDDAGFLVCQAPATANANGTIFLTN